MLISDMVNELQRERSLRRAVFPKLITQGRLSPGEAAERSDRLIAALATLHMLHAAGFTTIESVASAIAKLRALNTSVPSGTTGISIKGGK